MNEMKEAVGNWREAKQFSPADENDFLRWLDKADTEEKLFSRLTFWFTFRGLPADQNQRYHLVQERARELRLWNGLELKLRRWQDRVADEYEQIGKEAFAARIGEDYADYIIKLAGDEWDSEKGTWKDADSTYAKAFADDAFTADSATYKQAMTAYYTAYQQYSSQASSASSKWTEYANGLYAKANISIYGLFA